MLIADRLTDAPPTDHLSLTYETRCKSRQHLRLPSGEEFGYVLPPGTVLHDGDRLLVVLHEQQRVVEIGAAVEAVLEVRADDALHLARAAYHLGNRHVAVQVGSDAAGGYLRLQPDHVLADMLAGLGCKLVAVDAAFDPEGGAYGRAAPVHEPGRPHWAHAHHEHGHHHGHAEHDPGHGAHRSVPKIHEFGK